MALIHADFVEETTTTTGTGTLNLAGATAGHRTFVATIGDGNTCIYAIASSDGNFESGIGTVTDATPDTLARTTLLSSTTGSKLNLPSGTHRVYCTFAAEGGTRAYAAAPNLAHSAQTITTADVTGAVNTHYRCTIAGLTGDRYLTLPAGAAGDRIRVSLVDSGDEAYKLGIKGAAGITIDGGSAATLDRWLYTIGNFVEYEATSATNWQRISGASLESIIIACGNLVSPMTTVTGKVSFPMPYAFHLREIIGAVLTAPTGAAIIMDVNEAGTSVMTTNKLLIDATETSTLTASPAPTITDDFLAKGAIITVDFDQVGSTVAGVGPVVELIGVRA